MRARACARAICLLDDLVAAIGSRRRVPVGSRVASICPARAREVNDKGPAVAELGQECLRRPAEELAHVAGEVLLRRVRPEAGYDVLNQAVYPSTILQLLPYPSDPSRNTCAPFFPKAPPELDSR